MIIAKKKKRDYTIQEKIEYYSNRVDDLSLKQTQRNFASKRLQCLTNYLQEGKIAQARSRDLKGITNSKAFFHPVVINRINSDESMHVNVVSHNRSKAVRVNSLGENSFVKKDAYNLTKKNQRINGKNLFESNIHDNLSISDFENIINNTNYK